jgi:serine/threonine protein phosphatase 1
MIPNWIAFGGLATLNSYGVYLDHIATTIEDFTELQQQFKQKLPRDHYEFFIQTRLSYTIGSYFFVHAGIYPKRNLSDQYPDDLLWIRETFTRSKRNYGKIIVHGHTISDKPELLPNRIGIDTGAYMSGILTCLVLEDCYQRILQTQ